MAMDAETVVRKALEPAIKAETRRDKAAGSVVEALEEAGHLYENGWVSQVEVHGARVAVETVLAYGLVIEVDTFGNAVTVRSPEGFLILEAGS